MWVSDLKNRIMENTIENKEKFFALYWGQEAATEIGYDDIVLVKVDSPLSLGTVDDYYLKLKSVLNISDEDAVEIDYKNAEHFLRVNDDNHCYLFQQEADYLRSKSYLIGYNGLTPDQIIEYGWVKI